MIENFAEEEVDTTVHRICGQRATLSLNYKPGNWDSVRAYILKARSGWHQAKTTEDPQNMDKFVAGSLGAVTAHRIKLILSGRSAVEQMRQWQQALQAEQIMDAGLNRVIPWNSREKWRKCISVTGSLCVQAQVRPIDKLDEACTNADDWMMLVQHRSGDCVMS